MSERTESITREPKYAKIISQWEALWAMEDVSRPLWLLPTAPGLVATYGAKVSLPMLLDKEAQLQGELNLLKFRERTRIGDDFIPHLQPFQGVTVFASAFGCRVQFFEHTLPWAHPVIRKDDPPEKVYHLPKPEITDGQLGTMLEFTDHFVERTKGYYPVAVTDLQGPMDTSYLVWEPCSFLKAMYTNPEEVHHLMRLVTDLIIDYVKEQRARSPEFLPCHFPPLWLPDTKGLAMSDDCLAILGPKQYQEFSLPYVNQLSKEFGGVFIHSCGNFVHQFDVLAKIHNLRGINFGATETPFEAVWNRFGGQIVVAPHQGLNIDVRFDTPYQYLEHVLSTKTTNRGLCVMVSPADLTIFTNPNVTEKFLEEVNRLLKKHN